MAAVIRYSIDGFDGSGDRAQGILWGDINLHKSKSVSLSFSKVFFANESEKARKESRKKRKNHGVPLSRAASNSSHKYSFNTFIFYEKLPLLLSIFLWPRKQAKT